MNEPQSTSTPDPKARAGRFLSLLSDLVLLNLLFLLCCLPVITIGAAVAGLNRAALRLYRGEGTVTKDFFRGFRSNFKQATLIFLIFAVLGIFLFYDLYFLVQDGSAPVFYFLAGLIALWMLFTLTYLFPILVQFDNKLFRHITNAFLLSLRHLGRTIPMALLTALPLLLWLWSTIIFLYTVLIWVMIGFAGTAYLNRKLIDPILSQFL